MFFTLCQLRHKKAVRAAVCSTSEIESETVRHRQHLCDFQFAFLLLAVVHIINVKHITRQNLLSFCSYSIIHHMICSVLVTSIANVLVVTKIPLFKKKMTDESDRM